MAEVPLSESVDEHLERILSSLNALPPAPRSVDSCLGLVLAESVTALTAVPNFDNSAMDGYAVRQADLTDASETHPVTLPVVADLAAGPAQPVRLAPGTSARIMTGAAIPEGADAVVPIEATNRGTDRVVILEQPEPAAYIRRAGSDVRPGDPLLAAGTQLTARHLAAAIAVGHSSLMVHPAGRVGIVSTGSELVRPGRTLSPGQIYDTNTALLAGAVTAAGGTPVAVGPIPDDEHQLSRALTANQSDVDAFILSGGASVGAYDVVKALLSTRGIRFAPVRMQPGKPQGYGLWNGSIPIFCLPGNPVSAYVSFEVFVRPALRKLQGHQVLNPPRRIASVTEGWRSPRGRQQYMPVVVQSGASGSEHPLIKPASAGGSGSHLIASLAKADAFAVVPEEVTEVHPRDGLPILMFNP